MNDKNSMSVMEAIRTRKSVRSFLDKPVEEEKLNEVLEAARLAPSAKNLQEWRFVVVRDPETKKIFAGQASGQAQLAEASVVIAACAETDERMMKCGQKAYPIDVALALDHITLAAAALGLGTCWIGGIDGQIVKQVLGIPEDIQLVGVMCLGYPADPSPVEKSRLPLEKVVKYEHW
ncbi:MAG: nitroreductase family protein [Anaerolineales bacterium]|nr:nitroreductase family protein [Anaerolineales bacterium]